MPARQVQAQWLTTDLSNLAQNTRSPLSDAEAAIQDIRAFKLQIEQFEQKVQDLQKLDIRDLGDLEQPISEVIGLIDHGMAMASRWGFLAKNFARIYGEDEPPEYDGDEFWVRRHAWQQNTERAFFENLKAQADAGVVHGHLFEEAKVLSKKAKTVKGTVAATELATQTFGVLLNQQAISMQAAIAAEQAQQIEKMEQRRKAQAARRRQLDRLGRGFGQVKPTANPVILRDF